MAQMRPYQIVSAPFGSGVSWLINVLLELGIRATHVSPRYPDQHWVAKNDGTYSVGPDALEHLRWHLPILHQRESFSLNPEVEVFWEHRLDFARHLGRPTLVYVRDPRDALYSLYKRHYANSFSLLNYLRRPDLWPDHFPDLFNLPPPETWAVWHAFWLGMDRHTQIKIVRFEDMRARPIPVVQEILAFLGVSHSDDEIARALSESTFEKAKTAMQSMETATGRKWLTARAGQANEWKTVYEADTLSCFHGPALSLMSDLGYSQTESPSDPKFASAESLYKLMTDARIQKHVSNANASFPQGQWDAALTELRLAVPKCGDHQVSLLALGSMLTASDWARKVFGAHSVPTSLLETAREVFQRFLERFASNTALQRVMLQTAKLASGQSNTLTSMISTPPQNNSHQAPQLVAQGIRGFNLVAYQGRVFALAQKLGPVNLEQLDADRLQRLMAANLLYVGQSATELEQKLLAMTSADHRPA
jgi:hypothetical protein